MLCRTASRNCSATYRMPFPLSTRSFSLELSTLEQKKTQVQSFKKGVSNSATQNSIMNTHNKTQSTYAIINYALKDSSCDSPIAKSLMLTILTSNASSSLDKVFECPHTKNDFILTHNGSIISSSRIKCNAHSQKDEDNACFHP
ncbi:hypothetical protein H5410_032004 [Solanum commersonii]|uniref:Uncharacterized protein n=1 Tax=Solanum commersonii TaxID=4109 RepID=A0A9J5YJT9_SOLCO|nr:hypothetical protein H5410_032004 [Solanum commersonii]